MRGYWQRTVPLSAVGPPAKEFRGKRVTWTKEREELFASVWPEMGAKCKRMFPEFSASALRSKATRMNLKGAPCPKKAKPKPAAKGKTPANAKPKAKAKPAPRKKK